MKIGSLFSGAGGLDIAVEHVFSGRTVWHCEVDPAAVKVLAHRWPGVPNLGDITAVDWSAVEPVDVLCGGFPCQDVSAAGRRAGIQDGTRSGLWSMFADAIDALRPQVVVVENVRGLLSARAHRAVESGDAIVGGPTSGPVLRAAGAVLGDLADLGYDAQWSTVSAASVGAPHRRERVFILATAAELATVDLLPTPRARDGKGRDPNPRGVDLNEAVALLPTPSAQDGNGGGRFNSDGHQSTLPGSVRETENWGKYAPAIARWEAVTRPAPTPTEPNTNGNPRLTPAFPEWMLGWPAGWVTAVPGISRNDMLRIIGNGVCPQQAAAALLQLLPISEVAA